MHKRIDYRWIGISQNIRFCIFTADHKTVWPNYSDISSSSNRSFKFYNELTTSFVLKSFKQSHVLTVKYILYY